ncbi:hypothetical protein B0T19DRAFT_419916 [Cercophora scortea]|uniref:Uncharacterized protein n=1 Tax=Cercophora scortea TaxID=314031 RepID=A0AAE0IZ85_9PEZI|nr:hypothetical protein B0T19DRAFT_419916 [Cercophora scortea]
MLYILHIPSSDVARSGRRASHSAAQPIYLPDCEAAAAAVIDADASMIGRPSSSRHIGSEVFYWEMKDDGNDPGAAPFRRRSLSPFACPRPAALSSTTATMNQPSPHHQPRALASAYALEPGHLDWPSMANLALWSLITAVKQHRYSPKHRSPPGSYKLMCVKLVPCHAANQPKLHFPPSKAKNSRCQSPGRSRIASGSHPVSDDGDSIK